MKINKLNIDRTNYILKLKNSLLMFASELGRRLERGDYSSEIIDSNKLQDLLNEFNLEEYMQDFLILSEIIIEDYPEGTEMIEQAKRIQKIESELVSALIFLHKYNDSKIHFTYKHKFFEIQNKLLINKLKKELLKLYIENNIDFKSGSIKLQDIEDWVSYFETIKAKEELIKIKKGRPYKNEYLGFCTQELFIFLQYFTPLTAQKGILISRRQASFIYKYLDLLGLIDNGFTWEVDNIIHILKEYNKRDPAFQEIISSLN